MKKITAVCMCGLMAAALMTGCGKKAAVDSVKLGEYKGVSYTPVPVEVTDEQVEAEIQGLLDEHAVETEVDRAAKEGDIVNIDFVGMAWLLRVEPAVPMIWNWAPIPLLMDLRMD